MLPNYQRTNNTIIYTSKDRWMSGDKCSIKYANNSIIHSDVLTVFSVHASHEVKDWDKLCHLYTYYWAPIWYEIRRKLPSGGTNDRIFSLYSKTNTNNYWDDVNSTRHKNYIYLHPVLQ